MGKGLVNNDDDDCDHDNDQYQYTFIKTLLKPLTNNIWLIYHRPKSIETPQP